MDLQNVYCSKNFFEEIVLFYNETPEYNLIFTILYEYSNVLLDISDDEFDRLLQEDGPYKIFIKREACECIPLPDFFKNIENDDLETYSTDLFFLDKEIEYITKIRNKKGLFVYSLEELKSILELNKPLEYTFSKERSTFSGWADLFKAKNITPINGAIIIDNYLFKDFDDRKDENILSIIANIIPAELDIPFHLTIITDNSAQQIKKKHAEKIAGIISDHINKIHSINPEVGIVTHSKCPDFHKRVILTNHFYIYSDKGFSIFKKGVVKEDTDGDIRWVYDSVCNITGDLRKYKHADMISKVTKLLNKNNNSPNQSDFIVGSSKNRLLN